MKKLTLTLSLLFASLLSVQAQVIFYEDFDGIAGPTAGGAGTYSFPSGWFLRNVDNRTPDTQVAYVNEAWERREDFNFNVADSCAFSTSWYSPVGAANDFMWTPMIGPLPSNVVLSWNAVTYDAAYPDGYEVRIMTTAPTGGTGVIGNQLTNSTVLFTTAAENTTWTARSVNLSAYAGQSVYIGFRNNSTDKFLLLIDDVKLEVQVNIDLELLFADTATEYTLIPQTQTAALNFNGTIRNNGLNALTNARAQVNVYNGVTNVYTATSTGATLASGSTAAWSVPSFTPSGVGVYTIEYISMQSSGSDQVPANDTAWQYFIVTDSTYARDDGNVTGSLGIGAGNGGYLGQSFVVNNSDLLTSIGMYVTAGYTGRNMGLCVWNTDAQGTPTTIFVTTDTLQYPDDSADYYVFNLSNGPVMLNPGTYVVTAIEFDSTLALGTTASIHTSGKTWVDWPTNPITGWANNEDFNFFNTYVIRPNFGDVCLDNSVSLSSAPASCIICADGSATATPVGADGVVTYSWAPSGGTAATATGLMPGLYTVTVTDGFGCVSSDTITVGYDVCALLSTSTASSDASCGICADGSAQVTVTGANGTVTYLWSNGGTSDTIQNVLPGMYYVTITDSLGCSTVDSALVNFSTDVAGLSSPGAVNVFPNPNDGAFQVKVNLGQATDLTIYITNVLGEVVATKSVAGVQNGIIDMNADLAAGIYSLHIRTADSEKVIPVTVQ